MMNYQKNIMKFGKKSTQISTIIKYQKNVFSVFARLEKTNKNDNYYQKHTKKLWKEVYERYQKKKKTKGKKRPKKDIKIWLKKKAKGLIGIFLREKKKTTWA